MGTLMRFASFIASAVGGILMLCPISGVAAQSGSGGATRSGWYVGGGIGPNWASGMDQEGWTRETTCYPTDTCFDADPVPEVSGYRWRYDIASAAGAAFEITAGHTFDCTRLELSFAQRKNGLNQMFRSITDYDGMPMEERSGGTAVSNARASIDHLSVSTLAFNAYYDFPDAYRGISPYLGAGLGPAFVEVSGVHFSTDYKDTSGNTQAYDPSPVVLQQPPGRGPFRHGLGRAPARRGRLRPERQDIVGAEVDLLNDGRHRIQRRILASPVSRAGPRLPQPQYVHGPALLDAVVYSQVPVRQLNRSI